MKRLYNKFIISIILVFTMLLSCFPFNGVFKNVTIAFSEEEEVATVDKNDLKVYFFPLGANYNGDSCIISVGDVQILVDAGVEHGGKKVLQSVTFAIEDVIDHHDLYWDYVIVTHADTDHISGFSTDGDDDSIFQKLTNTKTNGKTRKIGTLIDFDYTNDESIPENAMPEKETVFNSHNYEKYANRRDDFVEKGLIENYYTASQCCWEKRGVEKNSVKKGATDEFEFSAGSKKGMIKILYNYYYDHMPAGAGDAVKANVLSVCFMIEFGKDKFLFTGDLEEYDSGSKLKNGTEVEESKDCCNNTGYKVVGGEGNGAETLLLKYNQKELSGGVSFYKLAHHGSRTSSSKRFINTIKPKIAVCPASAGSDASRHAKSNSLNASPSKIVLDNLLQYTDYILTPSKSVYDLDNKISKREDYYGKILITSSGNGVKAYSTSECKEDGEVVSFAKQKFYESKPITETEWYKNNREDKLKTYVFSGYEDEDTAYLGNCTLAKYGSVDVLIDCGVYGETSNMQKNLTTTHYIDKIKEYCTDGVIDYLIVTSPEKNSISQLVDVQEGGQITEKGILSLYDIGHIIDGNSYDPSDGSNSGLYSKYVKQKNTAIANGLAKDNIGEDNGKSDINKCYNHKTARAEENAHHFSITDEVVLESDETKSEELKIEILNNGYYGSSDVSNRYNSYLCTLLTFKGEKLLFTSNNGVEAEKSILANNGNKLKDITFFLAGDYGKESANSEELLKTIDNDNLHIVVNAIDNHSACTKEFYPDEIEERFKSCTNKIYRTLEYYDKKFKKVYGDILFEIAEKGNKITRSIRAA